MFVGGGANPDAYNKQTKTGKGTLMLNWFEEDVLRETTGEGRTLGSTHIAKKREELYLKPGQELQNVYIQSTNGDQTFDRIFGRRRQPSFNTENTEKYSGTQPNRIQAGRKNQLIEQQFLNTISNELHQKKQDDERVHNERNFGSTYSNEFATKPSYQTVVGRRVMRDQNGNSVAPENRDVDILVEHGFVKPTAILPDSELRNLVKPESYVTSQPITFYTEKQKDGTFYATKAENEKTAFNKNNDFVKTYTNYKNKVL